MRQALRYLLFLFLFWLGVFYAQQIIFLLFNADLLNDAAFSETLWSFRYSLANHVSAACYLLILPVLFIAILSFKEFSFLRRMLRWYNVIILLLSAVILVSDLGLFEAWGTRMNHKALSYLIYPEESAAGISGKQTFLFVLLVIGQVALGLFFLRKIKLPVNLSGVEEPKGTSLISRISLILLFPSLLVMGMRGGLYAFPMDRSWSYYSTTPTLNASAVNGVWNFLELVATPSEVVENPYHFMPQAEAERITAEMLSNDRGVTKSILNTKRPNVVLILLESWSGDIIEALGGEPGVAPQFEQLTKEGLLFENFYSSGFRTEQGLCAMISGFPSQPKTTIIRKFGKFEHLPSVVNVLAGEGYSSSYFYTGNVDFANTRAYLNAMGFQKVHSRDTYQAKKATQWGAYDEELFDLHLNDDATTSTPFFHVIMTSTSHEPFDGDVPEVFPGSDVPNGYRNTVHYTDAQLGRYIREAKKQPWYDNTLFVIAADHGHPLPLKRSNYEPERYRIAFLMCGGALTEERRNTRISKYADHTDFVATLLAQLDLPQDEFNWSRNVLAKEAESFAFFSFDHGFGIMTPKQGLVYDLTQEKVVRTRNDSLPDAENTAVLKKGEAYLQTLMERYVGLDQ